MSEEIKQPAEEEIQDDVGDDEPEVVPHSSDDKDRPWCVGFFG